MLRAVSPLELPGLPFTGPDPAARRRAVREASDDDLVEACVSLARSLREPDLAPLARAAGLPLAEVVASPFAVRAVALGVQVGATSRHRELRASVDWTEHLAPEVADPEHDVWDRGVLATGKYQGFTADAPHAIYDPAHVSKWGPHEMMHRAAGFFWRPGLTRWELYLSARLNELAPVVLWYGPEQVMRLEEGAFDRKAAGASPAARLAHARWRVEDDAALVARARRTVAQLRDGIAHFDRELSSIDAERARGVRVPAPHPFLDSSSDATAYVVGHHARLTSPDVAAALSIVPEETRASDIGVYRDRVEALFDRLLFSPLRVDYEEAAERRARRTVWDLLLRAGHLGDGADEDLEDDYADAAAVLRGAPCDVDAWRARVRDALGRERAAVVLADGSSEGRALDALADGVGQVVPCAWALLDQPDALARFAASEAILDRAPLHHRACAWLEDAPPAVREMAAFEAAIAGAKRDDGVERLCADPDHLPDLLDGRVMKSGAFGLVHCEHDVLTAHAAFAEGELTSPARAPVTLLVGAFFDEVSVVPLPDAVARVWAALEGAAEAGEIVAAIDADLDAPSEGFPTSGDAWIRELCLAGALGYSPR